MIRGIGVDAASISDLRQTLERIGPGGAGNMFTARELAAAKNRQDPAEYLAARFAAKEAVFKAVAPLLSERSFDFRKVETLNREDGSPFVNIDGNLRLVLARAGVGRLHISITTEGDIATAFVVAEREA